MKMKSDTSSSFLFARYHIRTRFRAIGSFARSSVQQNPKQMPFHLKPDALAHAITVEGVGL